MGLSKIKNVSFYKFLDVLNFYKSFYKKLTNEQTLSCECIISEDEVFKSLKSIDNNKSPGNDGLSKEFYECFWDEIKKPFLASVHKAFLNQELSTSQNQAVIKMLEKRTKIRDSLTIEGLYNCLIQI